MSRRFLPTDVGSTPEETRGAYRSLYERGIIERVDGFPGCQILQTRLGEDRAFVESLEPRDHDGDRCVEVRLRYSLDTDEAEMERAVRFLLTSWLRSRAQLA